MVLFRNDTMNPRYTIGYHHRLRKWLATGQIRLQLFFERLRNDATDSLEKYEMLRRLASPTAKPRHKYTPKMGRTCQQRCIMTVTLSYSYLVILVSVWRPINLPARTPKLRSLVWHLHAGGYKQ
jgi:hypothetical protein